ncbi:hypothetical protein XENOCAPTIV_010663 [Xenoophorus captivus]|uniref:Uncharacterized protein n=1 Tax=Xenoophorus captivus TaxID=1517983 RepID=A0ABV0RU11_9TELE
MAFKHIKRLLQSLTLNWICGLSTGLITLTLSAGVISWSGGASCRGAGMSTGCVGTVHRPMSFILGSFLILDLFSLAVVLDIQWQCVV